MSRRNFYTGKWALKKAECLTAKYFALQYNELIQEYKDLDNFLHASASDGLPHGSEVGQPTERMAVRMAELRDKIEKIESTAMEADPVIAKYILKAVTNDNVTFKQLQTLMDIPCGRDLYYEKRRKYYYLLAHKI